MAQKLPPTEVSKAKQDAADKAAKKRQEDIEAAERASAERAQYQQDYPFHTLVTSREFSYAQCLVLAQAFGWDTTMPEVAVSTPEDNNLW